ncbi:uncharacterized protein LOC143147909 [Ptiloglossa arizonensis]|uniref:uncharacterized protein LOC143147909 n=1 Tax=Ptiloglossa arizonensis TaxID=3350558 RepID=UPI003F9F8EB4
MSFSFRNFVTPLSLLLSPPLCTAIIYCHSGKTPRSFPISVLLILHRSHSFAAYSSPSHFLCLTSESLLGVGLLRNKMKTIRQGLFEQTGQSPSTLLSFVETPVELKTMTHLQEERLKEIAGETQSRRSRRSTVLFGRET